MTEEDMDIDIDEEDEIQDLHQLNAVLNCDEPCPSSSVSQYSGSTVTMYTCTSANLEQYSKIEAALALNKMCDEKLRRLEKLLYNRLRECRERLSEVQDTNNTDQNDKTELFRYVCCGKPYFKDSFNFPAPDNEDTVVMAKTEMYDFSLVTSVSGWTVRDKSNFINLMLTMSQEIRKKNLNSKIAELQRQNKVKPSKTIDKKIAALRRDINKVSQLTLKEVALPIDQEYDWYSIANKLNRRHSASEYQSLWRLYLHPSINKSAWSKAEHASLQKIANDENLQDWKKIASILNTGRTDYQCFVYYRTNMSNTFTGRKWTNEEMEYLKRLIEYYKEDGYIPWGKVATLMENRTKIQIYNKYLRLSEQRKGRFLPEEDSIILTCAEKFGSNYHKMSMYLPGRSAAQCRVRYQVLMKKRISTVWTIEEDKRLIQLMANQDSSANFAILTKYFPGKDRIHIRARYLTLTRWMRRNPNVDIARAPRRGARRLGHGQSSINLNKAVDDLKKRIQTEVNSIKNKKLSKESPEEMIDDAIVACLETERVRSEETQKLYDDYETVDENGSDSETSNLHITNLQKILILLKAKLNKEKFSKSSLYTKYKGLVDLENTVKTFQLKCYSRKESVQNIVIDRMPDVWGNVRLKSLQYVFPPHYATITGCRKLMTYLNSKSKSEETMNVNVILNKNKPLKEQMHLLMERFNVLFLWPLRLSNTPPEEVIQRDKELQQYSITVTPRRRVCFDENNYNLAMPSCPVKYDLGDRVIDLVPSKQKVEINIKLDKTFPPEIAEC